LAAPEEQTLSGTISESDALEKYKILNDLWTAENSVKTNKLQMLMATNAILVSALALSNQPVVWIAVAGFVFSVVWIFSIGRTVVSQELWANQMKRLRTQFDHNPIFEIHDEKHDTRKKGPFWGRISSKYYLLGTPIGTTIAWFAVIIYTLLV
jgi:hypothetical protein